MENNEKTSIVNLLPCRIDYDGPAPVNSYFRIKRKRKRDDTKDILLSHFRGRQLTGLELNLTKDVIGFHVNSSDTIPNHFYIESSFKSVRVWEHDKQPDTTELEDVLQWFDVAKSVRISYPIL
jgi:hypothetical protein